MGIFDLRFELARYRTPKRSGRGLERLAQGSPEGRGPRELLRGEATRERPEARLVSPRGSHDDREQEDGEQLILPAGTLSDGSSVPRPLWGALDANPVDLLLPGFAHDFAYRRGAKWQTPGGGVRSINRYEADLLHIAVDRLLRVKKSDQEKIFYALRVGGAFAYRNRDVNWGGQS
jgi:hypothetical protein